MNFVTMKMITLILWFCPMLSIFSQESNEAFRLELSTDTILFGNSFEVRFTAENINGTFQAPKFDGYEIIGGPNQSSSMQIINGVSSHSSSYTYFLRPSEPGVQTILPSYFVAEEQTWETNPTETFCLPNPEGVVKESRFTDRGHLDFPSMFGERRQSSKPPKKELKVTKT